MHKLTMPSQLGSTGTSGLQSLSAQMIGDRLHHQLMLSTVLVGAQQSGCPTQCEMSQLSCTLDLDACCLLLLADRSLSFMTASYCLFRQLLLQSPPADALPKNHKRKITYRQL